MKKLIEILTDSFKDKNGNFSGRELTVFVTTLLTITGIVLKVTTGFVIPDEFILGGSGIIVSGLLGYSVEKKD